MARSISRTGRLPAWSISLALLIGCSIAAAQEEVTPKEAGSPPATLDEPTDERRAPEKVEEVAVAAPEPQQTFELPAALEEQVGPAAEFAPESASTTAADKERGCKMDSPADASMLEKARVRLTITACASSAWLDGLFGDQLLYDSYRSSYGTVSAGALWNQYDGFDPRLRFRVRLKLPNWDERISAFAGRVGEDDYVSDSEGDFKALPTRQFGGIEDESVLLGLGYSSPQRTGNDFDTSIGVRVALPLDPYARARYEIVRTFATDYVFKARQTVFWQNSEGFGTTTRFNIDRALSDRFLVRWNNVAKFTQETVGVEWHSEVTLFQSLGPRTGLAWQAYVEGATDGEVGVNRPGLRLIMRRQMTPDWLFLELRAGVLWPRLHLYEDREMAPEAGFAFEMQFGDRNKRND